jgi:hypothetical protein
VHFALVQGPVKMSTALLDASSADRQQAMERCIVFLSHATPDDNDFVVWLGARLSAAGYEVWSDVTRLLGGEFFWRNIDDAIRPMRRRSLCASLALRPRRKAC